jgi:hypothetical protein
MDYKYTQSSIAPFLSLIKILGDNITVVEVGSARGDSVFHCLQECDNIEKYIAIEPFTEYTDDITFKENGEPNQIKYDERHQHLNMCIFEHRLKFSSHNSKIKLIKNTSENALDLVPDKSVDFLFHDAFPTYEDAKFDFKNWLPKMKDTGIYSGHDFNHDIIQKAIYETIQENNIKPKLNIIGQCWFFNLQG